ncbi:hypothetical protein [Edaphobacter sp.]|uniref:hypothetical protein n=1 Tax=Edaphobacter sp. TaxID=1934404 RepID=UPI002D7FB259|nr:hypothetical protein [Edaphobacter sp.]
MAGMLKVVSIFNKKAGAASKPIVTTRYVRGNQMRTDNNDGSSEIIDLEAKHVINIDPRKRTYSIVTFDEMRASLERMQQAMKDKNVKMQVTPKANITETGTTRTILGQPAHEVRVQLDTEMQSTNPQNNQTGQATMTMNSDLWVAPSVTSYGEVRRFYHRMYQELRWTPSGNMTVNPQMSQGMAELQKEAEEMKGLPLLQYVSVSMSGMAQSSQGGGNNTAGKNPSDSSSTREGNAPSERPSVNAMNSLGALFGGLKNKKQEDQSTPPNGQGDNPSPPSNPNSLMDMTIQVTSFSNATLDGNLFAIPAGYTRVQANLNQMPGGPQHQ